MRQKQEEETYVLEVEISIDCADGSTHVFPVTLREREESSELELSSAAVAATLGPEDRLPVRIVKE